MMGVGLQEVEVEARAWKCVLAHELMALCHGVQVLQAFLQAVGAAAPKALHTAPAPPAPGAVGMGALGLAAAGGGGDPRGGAGAAGMPDGGMRELQNMAADVAGLPQLWQQLTGPGLPR